MKKGAKPIAADVAPPPPPPPTDTTASDLLRLFASDRSKRRLDLVEFTHAKYHDWLKYFGFSMEQELSVQQQHRKGTEGGQRRNKANLRATISMVNTARAPSPPKGASQSGIAGGGTVAVPSLLTPAGGGTHGRPAAHSCAATPPSADGAAPALGKDQCPFASNNPTAAACWTLPPGIDAVDVFALSLGPLSNCLTTKAVVEACIQPYKQVTWRLSAYACAHYKTRCIYRWICKNVTVVPPQPKAAALSVTIQDPGPGAMTAAGKKGGAPAASPASPTAGKKGGAGPADAAGAPPPSANPTDATLTARSADPLAVAQLFAKMCEEAGVEVEVVRGTLKGTLDSLGKPLNFVPWAWNIVKCIDAEGSPREYFVDVALSCMYMAAFDASNPRVRAPTPAQPGASSSPAAPSPQPPGAGNASNAAPVSSATGGGSSGSRNFVDTPTGTRIFEPFYYFTDPREFAPLHYPDEPSKLLLSTPVSRTHWEVAPRLNHEFFALTLKLDSHQRRCVFTTKSTPIYVSLLVQDMATTDLVCNVYRGHMAQFDARTAEPLEARFVWQQRDEHQCRVTFSIMVPDVGSYTIAIGGRSNPKRCGASVPNGPYFPTVVVYQALVNFVSVNEPMFPQQHLSPTVAKLLEPLHHKVIAGPQRFAVVPAMPNVLAVGVVNRVFKPPGAAPKIPTAAPGELPAVAATPRASAAKAKPPSGAGGSTAKAPTDGAALPPPAAPLKPPQPEIDRVALELLTLNPEKALFEGTVDLSLGMVELWLFFGDPQSLSVGGKQQAAAAGAATSLSPSADGAGGGSGSAGVTDSPVAGFGASPALPPPTPTGAVSPPLAFGQPSSSSSGSGPVGAVRVSGAFVPFVTQMQVVKRIPAKELSLNDGQSLIQPLPRLEKDRTPLLQMLTEAGDPVPPPRPVDGEGHTRPEAGSYFARRASHT